MLSPDPLAVPLSAPPALDDVARAGVSTTAAIKLERAKKSREKEVR